MLNTRLQTIQSCDSEAFPLLLAHLKITRDFSDTDSHAGNLGYRAEQLGEEHFQHFINYMSAMTWSQKKKEEGEETGGARRRLRGRGDKIEDTFTCDTSSPPCHVFSGK